MQTCMKDLLQYTSESMVMLCTSYDSHMYAIALTG